MSHESSRVKCKRSKKEEEKPVTARPVGEPIVVDGTRSLDGAKRGYDNPHFVDGCYRRKPHFFN